MPETSATDKRWDLIPGFLLVCAGASSWIALLLVGYPNRTPFILSGLMLVTGVAGLLVRRPMMVNLCLVTCSLTATLYIAEGGMRLFRSFLDQRERTLKANYAASQGRSFDFRLPREFMEAMWAQGRPIFPAFTKALLLRAKSDDEREAVMLGDDGSELVPLGSISDVETVRGNETGQYLVYRSDEHGFHNPPGIWFLPRLTIAAVGDSFVHGESVPSGRNMVAVIRSRVPKTLNLGHGGNGPLSELGSILEYLPARRPKIVLWVFSKENDIHEDLEREKRSGVLMGYLQDPPRLQALEMRQAEIDKKLRLYFESLMQSLRSETVGQWLRDWLTHRELALAVSQLRHPPQEDFALFERVLASAKKAVSLWNGSLVLVYLPPTGNIMPSMLEWRRKEFSQRNREQILRICSTLSIPVLDIERRLESEESKSRDYFYPYRGHFTEKGYQRVGEMILDELSNQDLLE